MHLTDVGTTSVPKEHILLHDDECIAQICSPSLVMFKKFSNGTKNSNIQKHLLPQIVLESKSRASEHFNLLNMNEHVRASELGTIYMYPILFKNIIMIDRRCYKYKQ